MRRQVRYWPNAVLYCDVERRKNYRLNFKKTNIYRHHIVNLYYFCPRYFLGYIESGFGRIRQPAGRVQLIHKQRQHGTWAHGTNCSTNLLSLREAFHLITELSVHEYSRNLSEKIGLATHQAHSF